MRKSLVFAQNGTWEKKKKLHLLADRKTAHHLLKLGRFCFYFVLKHAVCSINVLRELWGTSNQVTHSTSEPTLAKLQHF